MKERSEELLLDLLVKKAVEGLTEVEQNQLEKLNSGRPYDESIELTVSALSLVDIEPEEMPPNLRSRVLADSEHYFDDAESGLTETDKTAVPKRSIPWLAGLGWAAAGVMALFLMVNIWFLPGADVANAPPPPTTEENLTPSQLRQSLLDANVVNARADWAPGNVKSVAPVGDIVWSDERQAGYMRLRGLPVNDPGKTTYQLWIFDESQDPKTPIDGGTFDITSEGEAIIPIDAKLKARNPSMFAVTVEKPGGVVVSDRSKIAALAKV